MNTTYFLSTRSFPFQVKSRIKKKLRNELIEATMREELLIEVKREIAHEAIQAKLSLLEKKHRKDPSGDHEDEANEIDREVKFYMKNNQITIEEAKDYIKRLKLINT